MDLPKLSRWPVFSLLSLDFLQGVKLACVFGSSGNEAIVVNHDSEVFSLGSNSNGCLGVGDSRSSLQPRKLEALCKKGVVDLAYGSGPHVVALTSQGELFSWGHNGYGQLGQGASIITAQGMFPKRLDGDFAGVRVVSVACGGHHTVAVTAAGEVYAWGYNHCGQLGTGTTVNHTSPQKVHGVLKGVACQSVSCGHASSFTISQQGELFSWGYNGNGQLGIGNNTNQLLPSKVKLPESTLVAQVVCGYSHTMALSDNGLLFTWGSNTSGQLGTGNKANTNLPVHIGGDIGRFVEIAAIHNNHISAATLVTGKVYMWGVCRSQNILSPLETNFSSLDEVFACFSSPPCTWQLLSLGEGDDSRGLVKCIAGRFDDPNTADLIISVENKRIHVHKAILRMRCEYFNSMFQQGRWNESQKDTIEICQFSYIVYNAFLKYLYTDTVDTLSMEDTVGLLDLADSYCEKHLKRRCERLLWQSVSVENVTSLISIASKYKAESLYEFSFKFALKHMTQVVLSETFAQLDGSLAKEFIQQAAKHGVFKT